MRDHQRGRRWQPLITGCRSAIGTVDGRQNTFIMPSWGRSLIRVMRVNRPNSRFRTIATSVQEGTVLTGTTEEPMRW